MPATIRSSSFEQSAQPPIVTGQPNDGEQHKFGSTFDRYDLSSLTYLQPVTGSRWPRHFQAIEEPNAVSVQVVFMPWLIDDMRLEFQQKLRLIQAVLGRSPRLRGFNLEATTPFIVLDDINLPPYHNLDCWIGLSSVDELLRTCQQLLDSVRRCSLSKLYHGGLSKECLRLRVDTTELIDLDFLESFYCAPAPTMDSDAAQLYVRDVSGAVQLVASIAEFALSKSDSQPAIVGRKLTLLRKLILKSREVGGEEECFEQWIDFLDEVVAKPMVSVANSDDESEAYDDQTINCDPNIALPCDELPSHDTTEIQESQASSGNAKLEGTKLGRFQLERVLGRGGMGEVYSALDPVTRDRVAIKVLRYTGKDQAQAIRRFQKEGRLLASVQNPHVTQLLEIGFDNDLHYIAMEFVDGVNLKHWLRGRGPLVERQSLQLIRDVASALVEAHRRGIIHRDVKPENVLLANRASDNTRATADVKVDVTVDIQQAGSYLVKLTDFGIARHVVQSESMELTRAGAFLGTPSYMSPEQCKGGAEIDTSTDVYSLGVMLFELLSGNVPFYDADVMKLAAMHCFTSIPDLRKRNSSISEPTVELVHGMLAKSPAQRIANASQLIERIDLILEGKPNAFEAHPVLPAFDPRKLWKREFQWDLTSSAEELWQHVSDTERLNRAAGLPSVQYWTEKDPTRGIRRFGSFKLGGIKIQWEEHPFEWIEGSRFGVLREFSSGPFKWFMNTVELKSLPEGGTRLIHSVQIEPRNTLGRVVSTIEAGWKGHRALDRIYNRIDQSLQRAKQEMVRDYFCNETKLSSSRLQRLDALAQQLLDAGADVECTTALVDYIKEAPAQELSKMRPYALAKQLGLDAELLLQTAMRAAKAGMLSVYWDIICPTCRVAAQQVPVLHQIQQHATCEACDTAFQANAGDAVELVFKVNPEIREVTSEKYCIGGPWHAPHVVSQIKVAAGEAIDVSVSLEPGNYFVRTLGSLNPLMFTIQSSSNVARLDFAVHQHHEERQSTTLRAGIVQFHLTNQSELSRLVRIERAVPRQGVVTASQASASPLFRELFPDQVFDSKVPCLTEDTTFLAIYLHDLDRVYASLDDQEAYELLRVFVESASEYLRAVGGAMVKENNGELLAAFVDRAQAIEAAFGISQLAGQRFASHGVTATVCVHRDRALISKQNGRLDYFGEGVRTVFHFAKAMRAPLVVTDAVFADPVVKDRLKSSKANLEAKVHAGPNSKPYVVHCWTDNGSIDDSRINASKPTALPSI